ncbi:MAG: IS200/IS605 family transposase [Candidatus Marinimicrobia bacterium]|jgi:putative transposase|nr:IS200/IS605 family transposase [Candidatus Neomarinimicrobiota bacterium]MBT4155679.1 IS200/IS605 family transposase [Candidatus Neomarinimicrobiota bacterium]
MAFIKIWVHFVWTTKMRKPLLTKNVKKELIAHIKENALKKDIYIDSIDGGKEHLHALVSLGAKQSVSNVAQLLKGEASFWINKEKLVKGKFEWQDKYFAISVSESILSKVRKYIRNQEEHHKVKSFSEEYDFFMEKYGFIEQ